MSTPEAVARRQPVTRDLRALVTSMRTSADLERMGDLARHIATVARMRFPDHAVPEDLCETFAQMGEIGVELAGKVARILRDGDGAVTEVDARDDAVDRLHRGVFMTLLAVWEQYPSRQRPKSLCSAATGNASPTTRFRWRGG